MTVAAITSSVKTVHPFQVKIHIKNKEGKVLLNQVRTVDKKRLEGKIGQLNQETIPEVDKALKIALAFS